MDKKYFRITFEISANKVDNVFSITDWLNDVLGEETSNVDHVNVTEVTELIIQEKKTCPLLEDG